MFKHRSIWTAMVLALILLSCTFSILAVEMDTTTKEDGNLPTGYPPAVSHNPDRGEDCLVCHGENSFKEEIKTNHSQLVNCRQCHVADKVAITEGKDEQKKVMPTGTPPSIAHNPDRGKDCLACHGSDSSFGDEIKTDHSHLKNCRQCHV